MTRFCIKLMEGHDKIITDFGVGQNSGNYRVSQHPYKINFICTISVVSCEDDMSIPRHEF